MTETTTTTNSLNDTFEGTTLTTSKGKSVVTKLTNPEALEVLRNCPERTSDFGKDLVKKAGQYTLSHDQIVWTHILATEIMDKVEEEHTAPKCIEFMPEVVEILNTAKLNGLNFPKVRLFSEEGQKVVLSLAGDRAKFPGSVNVTDGGRYPSNVFFGRIHTDGRFDPSRENTWDVQSIVSRFGAGADHTAKLQGAQTGSCCFCGRHLETKESVAVGYGPTCAEKFGLSWGSTEGYQEKKDKSIGDSLKAGWDFLKKVDLPNDDLLAEVDEGPSLTTEAEDALRILND